MSVYDEIESERTYQRSKWGNNNDDTLATPEDWVAWIAHHSSRWFGGGYKPYNTDTVASFRKQMIKTAALAVAAVESIDRQRNQNSKTFYEE